jgi:hypothetical protein
MKMSILRSIKQSSEPDFYYGVKWIERIIGITSSGTKQDLEVAEALCLNANGRWRDKETNLEEGLIAKWSDKYKKYQERKLLNL